MSLPLRISEDKALSALPITIYLLCRIGHERKARGLTYNFAFMKEEVVVCSRQI